jgi:hypothetical protein
MHILSQPHIVSVDFNSSQVDSASESDPAAHQRQGFAVQRFRHFNTLAIGRLFSSVFVCISDDLSFRRSNFRSFRRLV